MPTNKSTEREVIFQVQARPLRLAYIIRHAADLTDAVSFYTHLWGGASNWIIPLPDEAEADVESFFGAIEAFDPDYIFVPEEITPRRTDTESTPAIMQELKRRNSPLITNIKSSEVRAFNALRGWMGCNIATRGGGRLGYLMPNTPILSDRYPQGLKPDGSRLVLPQPGGPFDFYLRLKAGVPCPEFAEYLLKGLSATPLRPPTSFLELLQAQLVCCGRATPTTTTTERCRTTVTNASTAEHAIFLDDDVLGLFLCESDQDLFTTCCFWNARGASLAESLILPRAGFEADLEASVKLLCEAFSVLRGIYVVTSGDELLLTHWHDLLKTAFADQGRDLSIRVMASGHHFPPSAPHLEWQNPITISRVVRSDNSVIFSPPVPPAHSRRDGGYAFACDLKVTLEGGRKLNLPPTTTSALLLSRELEDIEYAEREGGIWAEFYRYNASVRPHWNGLTIIATADGESTFFLQSDDAVVTRHLADSGCTIRANRQTRYARGIINLLGGYVEATRFLRNEGLEVLQTLCEPKARQCGLELPHIEGLANRHKHDTNDTAKAQQQQTTKRHLERLLETGLARRGFALTCPHCDLKEWHSVEMVKEKIACSGCTQDFALPFENPKYFYKANELAVRCLLDSGGTAVLMAAAAFRSIEDSGCIQFGADILRSGAPNFEVDLIWTIWRITVLVECKSLHFIGKDQISDISDSLDKTLEVATLLNAQVVMLAVSTPVEDISSICQVVEDKQANAEARGVALHLMVNKRIFINGRSADKETHHVSLHDLLPPQEQAREDAEVVGVGEWPKGGSPVNASGVNQDVIELWLNALRQ